MTFLDNSKHFPANFRSFQINSIFEIHTIHLFPDEFSDRLGVVSQGFQKFWLQEDEIQHFKWSDGLFPDYVGFLPYKTLKTYSSEIAYIVQMGNRMACVPQSTTLNHRVTNSGASSHMFTTPSVSICLTYY